MPSGRIAAFMLARMTLLLQVSDPHFGAERPQVVEALVRFALRQRPDLLVLSGDITQRATHEQFSAARAFVDRLGIATQIAIPGNHDIPLFNVVMRALTPYARYQRAFGDELEPVLDAPRWLVITVKTTRRRRHNEGEISVAQMDRVAERLRAARSAQLRIVVTHQPVAVYRERDAHDLVHGHAEAIRQWSAAGADLILGGHIHLPYVVKLDVRGDATRPTWAVQAGTAVSSRLRHEANNSVNLIRQADNDGDGDATPRRCDIERWDYVPASDSFERVTVESFDAGIGTSTLSAPALTR